MTATSPHAHMAASKPKHAHAISIAVALALMTPTASGQSLPNSKDAAVPGAGTAIRDIIPHKRIGQEICYAGTFTNQTIDMQDWSRLSWEIMPGKLDKEGKPATRPVPQALPEQDVSRIVLHLEYHNKVREGSFDVMFSLQASSNTLGKDLRVRSGCEWSGWDGEKHVKPETRLGCWVECDGGGFNATRIPGTRSLELRFFNLSVGSGCSEREGLRVGARDGGGDAARVGFRLEPAPLQVCKDIRRWGRKRWPA